MEVYNDTQLFLNSIPIKSHSPLAHISAIPLITNPSRRHSCSSSIQPLSSVLTSLVHAVASDPSERGLPSLDPRESAQFLLHGSPPSPSRCLFIAQLSLLSLRCILGRREEEQARRKKGGRDGMKRGTEGMGGIRGKGRGGKTEGHEHFVV